MWLYHERYKVSRRVTRMAKGRRLSRHAVVDVGSNAIHLLVREVDGGKVLSITGEEEKGL